MEHTGRDRSHVRSIRVRFQRKRNARQKLKHDQIAASVTRAPSAKSIEPSAQTKSRIRLCCQLVEKCVQHIGGLFAVHVHICCDRCAVV